MHIVDKDSTPCQTVLGVPASSGCQNSCCGTQGYSWWGIQQQNRFSRENANSSEMKCIREAYQIQWTSNRTQAWLQAGFMPARLVGCLEARTLRICNSRAVLPCRLPCSQGPQGFLMHWTPLFYPGLSSQLCKGKTKNQGNADWAVSTRLCTSQTNFISIFLLVQ